MEVLYNEIKKKIQEADAILIGASNGLSISEGLHLFADNQAFRDTFPELRRKYGIRCILQGMSFSYPSEEEKWGFWTRLITKYVHEYQVTPQMKNLKKLVGDKPYFIVTSNGETHFEMAGFDPLRIYEIEGSLVEMQCEAGCHETLYPVKEMIEKMAEAEGGGTVPAELVPHCPKCKGPMQMHLALNHAFIHNQEAAGRYAEFLKAHHNQRIVILELGIGWRNQLIKAPLMRLTKQEPYASYVTVNMGEIYIPDNIRGKSFGIDGDISSVMQRLLEV